jgi:hypothetical protein
LPGFDPAWRVLRDRAKGSIDTALKDIFSSDIAVFFRV